MPECVEGGALLPWSESSHHTLNSVSSWISPCIFIFSPNSWRTVWPCLQGSTLEPRSETRGNTSRSPCGGALTHDIHVPAFTPSSWCGYLCPSVVSCWPVTFTFWSQITSIRTLSLPCRSPHIAFPILGLGLNNWVLIATLTIKLAEQQSIAHFST